MTAFGGECCRPSLRSSVVDARAILAPLLSASPASETDPEAAKR